VSLRLRVSLSGLGGEMYGERCDLGAMENLAIELGLKVAGRGGRCLEALPLVAAKRVGLKARDRPVGVVVLPVRRTAGRRREGRFLLGWGWPVRGVSSRRYADGGVRRGRSLQSEKAGRCDVWGTN